MCRRILQQPARGRAAARHGKCRSGKDQCRINRWMASPGITPLQPATQTGRMAEEIA
jgi:hypothetical protein